MRRKLNIKVNVTALAIVLWLSLLPLAAFFVTSWFSRTTIFYIALILLPLWLTILWGICGWYIVKKWFN
jgi:hypothetical protein